MVQHGISFRRDADSDQHVASNMFGHRSEVEDQQFDAVLPPSRTNKYRKLAFHPLEDCILDTATVLLVATLHFLPLDAVDV